MYVKEKIIYSNVWEDPELNRNALKVNSGETVLSITSGGCNSLNLLIENPEKLISIDCNKAQLYLLELKKVGIKNLSFIEFRNLIGAQFIDIPDSCGPAGRVALYNKIKLDLSDEARNFWDQNIKSIKQGVIYCGSVEKFFSLYRKAISFLYDKNRLKNIFFSDDINEQIIRVSALPKKRWKFFNWLLLNSFVISLVKGKHSLKYVTHSRLDSNLNNKIHRAGLNQLLSDNYFLALILLGKFTSYDSVPPYLMERNYNKLKSNIDKLDIRFGTLEDVLNVYGKNSIDKFNLSNIMEWMDVDTFTALLKQVLALSKENSRFCYRYTLANTQPIPEEFKNKIIHEKELSDELFKRDRAFMYESFHVYKTNT